MVEIESAEGKKRDIDCIGCAIQRGEINSVGGNVIETKNFDVHSDYETPIPGFMIVASKKHIKGIEELTENERKELIELMYKIRVGMTEILKIKYIYIIQEEDSSSHFHVWMFPRHNWMEKFGRGIESVKQIMEYARKNLKTKDDIKKVKEASEKLREYLNKKK